MQPIIELRDITAGYDGRAQIRDVSLTVSWGDFIVVTGSNGSGKTTLMRVMLGLLSPMHGTVTYFRDGRPSKERPLFGYLPQYNAIDRDFPIDVFQTVLSGLNGSKGLFARYTAADRHAATRVMERMRIAELSRRPIRELSGGQLQRVLMARAIVAEPDILVLDEPTTYIDKQSWQHMHDILCEQHHSRSIVMVSHDREFISQYSPTKVLHMERLKD